MNNPKLKVHFYNPQHGCMKVSLQTEENDLELFVSYTPCEPIGELVKALLGVMDGYDTLAKWYDPEENELVFIIEEDNVRFTVQYHKYHRGIEHLIETLFVVNGTRLNICLAFWRAIRDLQGRVSSVEYKRNFRQDFPESEVNLLTEKIQALKHGNQNQTSR